MNKMKSQRIDDKTLVMFDVAEEDVSVCNYDVQMFVEYSSLLGSQNIAFENGLGPQDKKIMRITMTLPANIPNIEMFFQLFCYTNVRRLMDYKFYQLNLWVLSVSALINRMLIHMALKHKIDEFVIDLMDALKMEMTSAHPPCFLCEQLEGTNLVMHFHVKSVDGRNEFLGLLAAETD